jgi:glutathione S-transferase
MIDLYTWSTPNGRKVSIMLEECALPYKVHPINIGKGEQHTPAFLAINPNNRIPAIVDPDGPGGKPLPLFESGAILIYLGEKTGKFIPKDARARVICLQWLMFQMGGVGPMFGQAHHFLRAAPEPVPESAGGSLEDLVRSEVESLLRGGEPRDLHPQILERTERPLLEAVLAHTSGNQLRAAALLGINRNTLRKKLTELGIEIRERS